MQSKTLVISPQSSVKRIIRGVFYLAGYPPGTAIPLRHRFTTVTIRYYLIYRKKSSIFYYVIKRV